MKKNSYQLLDSGDSQKLEQFGEIILTRPCPQAIWAKQHPQKWSTSHAEFSREHKGGWLGKFPKDWIIELGGLQFKVAPTDFGSIGVFPEHAALWQDLRSLSNEATILNLFACSGGATMALAQAGAKVCHLDAAKGMVDVARANAAINGMEKAAIRWIVDDAIKFLKREGRRDVRYDAILLDPPTFGRGSSGEVFKIEKDIIPLLELCKSLLSNKPRFIMFSCHTPGITPIALHHITSQIFKSAKIETGEMLLASQDALPIPSGSFAKIILC
jgi:23S rRNA (cytosine1962-C5)-methyltransferase